MRQLSLALLIALVACGSAEAQKLYRWTDKDGKVHYSDHVPPEAVENARDELNKSGMKVGGVDRALTAEELAADKQRRKTEAELQAAAAEQEKLDSILLGSFGSIAELERSFAERFDLLDQSLESARIGIVSQEKSLADLLAHAAGLERQGKPVPANINSSIEMAKTQVTQQREYLAKREAEKVSLQTEFETTKTRYARLSAEREAAAAARSR